MEKTYTQEELASVVTYSEVEKTVPLSDVILNIKELTRQIEPLQEQLDFWKGLLTKSGK